MRTLFERLIDPRLPIEPQEVSAVIIQSSLLTILMVTLVAIAALRSALSRQSRTFFWLALMSLTYVAWNACYLLWYMRLDLGLDTWLLSQPVLMKGHLMVAVLLPMMAQHFLRQFLQDRTLVSRISLLSLVCVLLILLVPIEPYYFWVALLVGFFVFGSFGVISARLWSLYQSTVDLKLRTKSYFVLVGLLIATILSVIGQLRADHLLGDLPLPFLGNIFSAVFLWFLYQMVATPRLREIRELMLRGIRVLILAAILSVIILILLAWVGSDEPERFIFNAFIASFIILNVLEPLRRRMDRFFVRQFIVDRFEFEEVLRQLPQRWRSARSVEHLADELIKGVLESGRIYQAAFFLWEPSNAEFRLLEPSNLSLIQKFPADAPLIQFLKEHPEPLLQEQDGLRPIVRQTLQELNAHMVIPLLLREELIGIWALRNSLKSSNPYTSFSNEEIRLLERVSQDLISSLDQLQYFQNKERQERLAALGEMSAALAHEIRNPLGAVHGAIQLLQTSQHVSDQDDRDCIQIIAREIERMHKTVDQYLNFARRSEEALEVELPVLIRKVVDASIPKAEKTRTEIQVQAFPELPKLYTDPLKLEQVLFNLIQNACEAFSRNVEVVVRHFESERLPIVISVKDDGPGIPAHILPNVFTPLFTTKRAGSGLGLPICKKIVDTLGGKISVESRVGEGTVFTIRLPLEHDREKLRVVTARAEDSV